MGNLIKLSDQETPVLAGPWRFQIDQDDRGESEEWFSLGVDQIDWAEVSVPGSWDLYEQALWSYEGIGWYATEIPTDLVQPDLWQRLHFGRINNHTKVWLNGRYLGEHIGGFLPFEFAATPHLRTDGSNTLVLRVDNAPRGEWLPGAETIEWMQYGGILQPVHLLTTATAYISDLAVVATPDEQGARISCTAEVTNCRQAELRGQVMVRIPLEDSPVTGYAEVQCEPWGEAAVSITLTMPYARRWAPESPVLYEVLADLAIDGEILDSSGDRFGVRTIEVCGRDILLNGKSLRIQGVNRYDEYASFGPTAPEDVVRQDLMRIKQVGANLVRIHYPQRPMTLRLMDEVGLMMMEEIPLTWWRARWLEPTQDEHKDAVIDAAERALEDMIRRDKNHPCIIAWSMANECGTDTDVGIGTMRRLMRKARELDATRLVTFVANGDVQSHLAFDESHFVAANLYCGLFAGDLAHHIADMDDLVRIPTEKRLRQIAQYYDDKPLVVTEFGCHGILGLRGDARFTEDFQAAYIQAVWQAIENVPEVAGGVLWCWADYFHRRDFFSRGDGPMLQSPYGPYGVVTVGRRAKKSLQTLARMYGGTLKTTTRADG